MTAEIVKHDGEELTIQVKVKMKITGSLFEAEHAILTACNEVGTLASSLPLKSLIAMVAPFRLWA